MIYDASLDELLQKVWDGQRINQAEALRLYHLPLEELGALADRRRQLARADAYDGRGNEIVTYIVDRNINYTNVCNVYCKFCAFYRTEKDADAYVITFDEMDRKIEETLALGGTQILMQGGHHPKLTKQWYLDLLAHIKGKFPQVNIHGFSPSEFVHFREVFNEPLEKIIGDFKAAGLGSIPGGGGEILVDRVRQRISPLKAMSDDWLEVMDVAHRLGLNSSRHDDVRPRRDGGGPDRASGTACARSRTSRRASPPSSAGRSRPSTRSCRRRRSARTSICARRRWRASTSTTFPSVQSSWVTQGQEIGQVALKFGANDLGSIMIEENVVSQAGTTFRMTVADMHRLIRELGYEPHQRDNWYRLVN